MILEAKLGYKFKPFLLLGSDGCTVVEQLTNEPKIKGSNPSIIKDLLT
jgi:hypothetical protein